MCLLAAPPGGLTACVYQPLHYPSTHESGARQHGLSFSKGGCRRLARHVQGVVVQNGNSGETLSTGAGTPGHHAGTARSRSSVAALHWPPSQTRTTPRMRPDTLAAAAASAAAAAARHAALEALASWWLRQPSRQGRGVHIEQAASAGHQSPTNQRTCLLTSSPPDKTAKSSPPDKNLPQHEIGMCGRGRGCGVGTCRGWNMQGV